MSAKDKRLKVIHAQWKKNAQKYQKLLKEQAVLKRKKSRISKFLFIIAVSVAVGCMLVLAITSPLTIGIATIIVLADVCVLAYSNKGASIRSKKQRSQISPVNFDNKVQNKKNNA